jgi:DNA-binding PucR family transcriptional regulator
VAERASRTGLDVLSAVGSTVPVLAEVTRSMDDVEQVLRVLATDDRGCGLALVEDVWADIALLRLADLQRGRGQSVSAPVAAVLAHDAAHRTQHARTLRTYLDCLGDVRAAAERLALHPNSLRHRLRRVRELFGIDLDDPAQRLVVALELRSGG